jgi:hypothetical protein
MSHKELDNLYKFKVEEKLRPQKRVPVLMPDGTTVMPKRKVANSNP